MTESLRAEKDDSGMHSPSLLLFFSRFAKEILKREIGSSAVWSASSAKIGGSVSCVRDGSDKTFWQSDGSLPHTLSVQFLRRLPLVEAQIKIDYKSDESYTPARLSVRIGTNSLDLKELRVIETRPVSGWLSIPLLDAEQYVLLCLFSFVLLFTCGL